MKKFLKNLVFSFLYIFWSGLNSAASILMYHSVGDNKVFFTVKKAEFEKQLKYFKKKQFNVIFLSELIDKIKKGEEISRCVCLTFDDGYRDNYQIAFPLLKKYNFPATIFLATEYIGKQRENSQGVLFDMLSVDEIREMSESGMVEFMPHTRTHCRLDEISFDEARREIEESRKEIEQITGKEANIFSYPYGKFTKQIAEYLKNSRWRGAVGVKEGLIRPADDVFALKRNSIDSSTSAIQFAGKVSWVIDIYGASRR